MSTEPFGGDATARDEGLVRGVGWLLEAVGLLNKGSMVAPAAPDSEDANKVTAISSNTLNVTRVTGVAALIGTVGAATLAIFSVDKGNDPHAIVVAAYASTGFIVAAALIMVAIIVAADIKARQMIATAATTAVAPTDKGLNVVHVRSAMHKASLELAPGYSWYELDASGVADDTRVKLPAAKDSPVKRLELRRSDSADDRTLQVALNGNDALEELRVGSPVVFYVSGGEWHKG